MGSQLWLIGGTQESRWLVQSILQHWQPGPPTTSVVTDAPPLLISVTTEAATRLYPNRPECQVWVGRLTPEEGHRFIQDHGIQAILDASHPFATEISRLAIALAQRYQLPYLRYERPEVTPPSQHQWQDTAGRPGNLRLPHLKEVFAGGYLAGERTLLTLGYRWLASFAPWQDQGVLFARILPSTTALTAALAAGFTAERLIALRPPVSPSLEQALWQQWQLTQVITKASGSAGGEADKQTIAATLGIRLIRLARPDLAYPAQTSCLETAIDFALQHLSSLSAGSKMSPTLSMRSLSAE